MAVEHVHIFDKNIQDANLWIKELSQEIGWDDANRVYSVLRGTLHALRDRVPFDEAMDLGAQLPLLIAAVYYDGWKPAEKPERYKHKEEFLRHVAQTMPLLEDTEIEAGVEGVIRHLSQKVSRGEFEQVVDCLPKEVNHWWHQAVHASR